MTEDLLRNRLRCFRSNFTIAIRTERVRNARTEKFQVIIDFRHCADGRSRSLDGIRLLDGDCGWNAADIVNARLVHSMQELPHVWTERFDVTSLAFRINRLERQTGLSAPAGACNDRQFSQRKINIDPFEIVLARPTNLNVILRDWRSEMFCARNLRTHWKYSPPVKRFANFQAKRMSSRTK